MYKAKSIKESALTEAERITAQLSQNKLSAKDIEKKQKRKTNKIRLISLTA